MSTNLESWIDEDNLIPVIQAFGWLCGYRLTSDDEKAVKTNLRQTSTRDNAWYDLVLVDKFSIELQIAMDTSKQICHLRISSKENVEQGVMSILGLAQRYKFRDETAFPN